jgi:hypothetical protein
VKKIQLIGFVCLGALILALPALPLAFYAVLGKV